LSARNVLNGTLSFDDIDFVSHETHRLLQKRLRVVEGDVLLSCSGSVGRSCTVPPGIDFSLVRSVAVLRPAIPIGRYMSLALRSPLLQRQIARRKTQTAQANIFQGSIKKLVIPLAPMAEINQVVDGVETRLSASQALANTLRRANLSSSSTRNLILKHAFDGWLVPQKQGDEPASTLLERIAAKRDVDSAALGRVPTGKRTV
jgi:type I restriction enzyme S subunit